MPDSENIKFIQDLLNRILNGEIKIHGILIQNHYYFGSKNGIVVVSPNGKREITLAVYDQTLDTEKTFFAEIERLLEPW